MAGFAASCSSVPRSKLRLVRVQLPCRLSPLQHSDPASVSPWLCCLAAACHRRCLLIWLSCVASKLPLLNAWLGLMSGQQRWLHQSSSWHRTRRQVSLQRCIYATHSPARLLQAQACWHAQPMQLRPIPFRRGNPTSSSSSAPLRKQWFTVRPTRQHNAVCAHSMCVSDYAHGDLLVLAAQERNLVFIHAHSSGAPAAAAAAISCQK